MEKCVAYVKGGPTYKDQMYDKYMEQFNQQKLVLNEFEPIWDNAVKACEEVHNERIRNIITPFASLITLMTKITEDEYYRDEAIKMVKDTNIIEICNNSMKRLLNIPEQ